MFAVSLARHWSKKFARLPFDISRCFRVPLWFISSTSSLKSSSRYLLLYELNKEGCLAARHGGNCSWLPLLRLPGTSGQFFSAARINLGLCLVVWFSRLLFFVLRGFFSFRFAPSLVVILSFCIVVEHSLVYLCCNSVPRQCAVFSLGLFRCFAQSLIVDVPVGNHCGRYILVIQMSFLQGTVAMSIFLPAGILDVWPSVTSQGPIWYHLCSYVFVHSSFRLSLSSSFWCREVYCSWLPQDVLHFTGVADDLHVIMHASIYGTCGNRFFLHSVVPNPSLWLQDCDDSVAMPSCFSYADSIKFSCNQPGEDAFCLVMHLFLSTWGLWIMSQTLEDSDHLRLFAMRCRWMRMSSTVPWTLTWRNRL